MGTLNTSLGFSISDSLKYSPGGSPVSIEIKGSTSFTGILIFVYKGSDSGSNHVGKFQLPSTSNYKFMEDSACSDESTVTHSSKWCYIYL